MIKTRAKALKNWLLCFNKMNPSFKTISVVALAIGFPLFLVGQGFSEQDCFRAVMVSLTDLPGQELSLSSHEEDQQRVYYQTDDYFTFWYRLKAEEEGLAEVSVWPTNSNDQFQVQLYRNPGESFCKDMVVGNARSELPDLIQLSRKIGSEEVSGYLVSVEMSREEEIYLCILAMTPEHCGHRADFKWSDARQTMHAINKPCYNYEPINQFEENQVALVENTDDKLIIPSIGEGDFSTGVSDSAETIEAAASADRKAIDSTTYAFDLDNKKAAENAARKMNRKSEVNVSSPVDQRIPEVAQAPVLELASGKRLNLEEILFYNNTFAFRPESSSQLNALLNAMQENQDLKIAIHGHTAGNTRNIKPDPNLVNRGEAWRFKGNSRKLSLKRAEAVKEYLTSRGIEAKRITTFGHGDTEKRIPEPKTPSDHMKNMRVEVEVIADK